MNLDGYFDNYVIPYHVHCFIILPSFIPRLHGHETTTLFNPLKLNLTLYAATMFNEQDSMDISIHVAQIIFLARLSQQLHATEQLCIGICSGKTSWAVDLHLIFFHLGWIYNLNKE